jgi:hypothetical protein
VPVFGEEAVIYPHADQLRLRLSLTDGPELRCPHCGEWWPITTEFWRLNKWHRCIACERERARLYSAIRRQDPTFRADQAVRSKRYREWLKRACPENVAAYDRERQERRRVAAKAARAKTMAKMREAV